MRRHHLALGLVLSLVAATAVAQDSNRREATLADGDKILAGVELTESTPILDLLADRADGPMGAPERVLGHGPDLGHPIAVEIGPIAIRWYALAYVVGLVFGWWYVRRIVSRRAEARLGPLDGQPGTPHSTFTDALPVVELLSMVIASAKRPLQPLLSKTSK